MQRPNPVQLLFMSSLVCPLKYGLSARMIRQCSPTEMCSYASFTAATLSIVPLLKSEHNVSGKVSGSIPIRIQ